MYKGRVVGVELGWNSTYSDLLVVSSGLLLNKFLNSNKLTALIIILTLTLQI